MFRVPRPRGVLHDPRLFSQTCSHAFRSILATIPGAHGLALHPNACAVFVSWHTVCFDPCVKRFAMNRIALLSFCLLLTHFLDAQRRGDNYWGQNGRNNRAPSLSGALQFGQPVGEFAREMNRSTAGFSAALLANQGRSPLEWGVQFAYAGLGREHQEVTWDLGVDDQNNIVYQDGRLRVRGNMYQYHGVARLKPFAGAIQPYGDVMLGAKHFVLKSQIQEEYNGYREVIESNREESSAALSYGCAAGLKVRLNRSVMLEARYERLHGGRATFVDAESISIDADGSFT